MTSDIQENAASSTLSRRSFLAGTGATVALTVLHSPWATGAESNSKINVGLIGCGGRGRWIAELFQQHGGYNVVAVTDYFKDRVDEAGQKLNVPEPHRYTGLNGYKRLLEQKDLQAVIIQTPPYFHPQQAQEAVAAGKHVYLAKPVAVDVPGCMTVLESGKKASASNLCFMVDFQTRANKAYQEAIARIHAGELGKTVLVEATYQCSLMFENLDRDLRKDPQNAEVRLRAWAIDRALSGDIITEQNIHALDVAAWMLNAEPVKAVGAGGRRREFIGDCWDHFAVIFHYPGDVIVSFNSHQSGFGYDDIMCRLYGLNGTVDTHYAGKVTVRTKDFFSDGTSGSLYKDGTVTNIDTFHKSITRGEFGNTTVPASVRSNLTTILGRTAAYEGREVTWQDMMTKRQRLEPDIKGLKA